VSQSAVQTLTANQSNWWKKKKVFFGFTL
jgi:hypothetical protein